MPSRSCRRRPGSTRRKRPANQAPPGRPRGSRTRIRRVFGGERQRRPSHPAELLGWNRESRVAVAEYRFDLESSAHLGTVVLADVADDRRREVRQGHLHDAALGSLERNLLLFDFVRLVDELRPRYFAMENVPPLKNYVEESGVKLLDRFVLEMEACGYRVLPPQLLNASRYGVPQDRRRLIVLERGGDRSPLRTQRQPFAPCRSASAMTRSLGR